jgi:hypothetical protein
MNKGLDGVEKAPKIEKSERIVANQKILLSDTLTRMSFTNTIWASKMKTLNIRKKIEAE